MKLNRKRLALLPILGLLLFSYSLEAQELTICSRDDGGRDGSLFNQKFDHMRKKLQDPAIFGPSGVVSKDIFILKQVAQVNDAGLRRCDIWFSGNTGLWTEDEKTALKNWLDDGENHRFVMGGCDDNIEGIDDLCLAMGLPVQPHAVVPTELIESFAGDYASQPNPLTCGGATEVETSGNIAANFFESDQQVVLLRYVTEGAFPGVVTDTLTGYPKFLLSGDIDMWSNSLDVPGVTLQTDGLVSAGSDIKNANDLFMVNVFKYAADAVTGRIAANGGPLCASVYEDHDPVITGVLPDRLHDVGDRVEIDLSTYFSDADRDALNFQASVLPEGLTLDAETGLLSGSPTAVTSPSLRVVISVDDGNGGVAAKGDFSYVIKSHPIKLAEIPDQVEFVGDAVQLGVHQYFIDQDGDVLTFSAQNLPAGLSIDSGTGVISGTPTEKTVSSLRVVITVSDGNSELVAEDKFLYTIKSHPQTHPHQPLQEELVFYVDDVVRIDLSEHFVDADSDVLTYHATNLPEGVTLDTSTGIISGRLTTVRVPGEIVTVTASDGSGGVSATDSVKVVVYSHPKRVGSIPDRYAYVGDTVDFGLAQYFADADGDVLKYSLSGLPKGLAWDSDTGRITGKPTEVTLLPANVYVTVTDTKAIKPAQDAFVFDIHSHPELVREIPDQLGYVGDMVNLDLSAYFRDIDGDNLTYSADVLPSSLVLQADRGVLRGTLTEVSPAGVQVTVSVNDGFGGVHTEDTFLFKVRSHPKRVIPLPPVTNRVGDYVVFELAPYFNDADGDELQYGAEGLPSGLSLDTATGIIRGTITDATNSGPVNISVGDGNVTISSVLDWQVLERNHAPSLISELSDLHASVDEPIQGISLAENFTDVDGDTLIFSATDLPEGLSMMPDGKIQGTPTVVQVSKVMVTVADGRGGQQVRAFNYHINPAAEPVSLEDAVYWVDESAANGSTIVRLEVSDPNLGSAPEFSIRSGNEQGAFTLSDTGVLSVADGSVLNYEDLGEYVLEVEADDGSTKDSATLTIRLRDINESPVAVDDTAETIVGQPIEALDVLGNDFDPENDGLRVRGVAASHGEVRVLESGLLQYTPPEGFAGTALLTYTLADRNFGGLTDEAQVRIEVQRDHDRDGIIDQKDPDDDNDGIPDAIEGDGDDDNDGVPNRLDLDADDDGLSDAEEGAEDQDKDGKPNYLDTDADNDGIADLLEARVELALMYRLDTDGDGVLDSSWARGANGWADEAEKTAGAGQPRWALADSDKDGIPDVQDRDSDGDGLPDTWEAGHVDGEGNGEWDLSHSAKSVNGLASDVAQQANTKRLRDTDGDSVPDFRDLDSDNDGIPDVVEAGGLDINLDGLTDDELDEDRDGLADAQLKKPLPRPDSDADRVPNHLDLDADNDGLSDLRETAGVDVDRNGRIDRFYDRNNNGLNDAHEVLPTFLRNSDKDALPDYLDRDSDDDGRSDLQESGSEDLNGDGVVDALNDRDRDGLMDSVDVGETQGTDADADGIDDRADADFNGDVDTDGDGISDRFDGDPDGDGFSFPKRAGLHISGGGPSSLPDSNNNGLPDVIDPALATGVIRTGLSGAGCSLGQTARDPVLGLLLAWALLSLGWRAWRCRRH